MSRRVLKVWSRMSRMWSRMLGRVTPPLTCGVADVPDVPDESDLSRTHAGALGRGVKRVMENIRDLGHLGPKRDGRGSPRIVGGTAYVDGQRHTMRIARPASETARLYGMNPNHHVRVWCTCMDARRFKREPESLPARQRFTNDVTDEDKGALPTFLDDPRSLGDVDWLGIADVRVPNSALSIFRRHLEEAQRESGPDSMP